MNNIAINTEPQISFSDFMDNCRVEYNWEGAYIVAYGDGYEAHMDVLTDGEWRIENVEGMELPNEKQMERIFMEVENFIKEQ